MKLPAFHSDYFSSDDPNVINFYNAVGKIEQSEQHPLSNVLSATPVLPIITANLVNPDFWKIKYDGLCAVILTNESLELEIDGAIIDPLGRFFTLKKLDAFEKVLPAYKLNNEHKKQILKYAREMVRNGHEYCPVIVILKSRIEDYCEKKSLDFSTVVRMVIWHELGHLIFNPGISVQAVHPDLLKPTGKYKQSKAMQFLIEGTAEWFAYHAEEWDAKYLATFNLNDGDLVDEYSYISTLNKLHPVMLQRILLPFIFNCLQSTLCNLPVDDGKNPILKLKAADFVVPEQGMDYEIIDGFLSRVAKPLNVRFGFNELLLLKNIFPEFIDQDVVDDKLLKGLGLPPEKNDEKIDSDKILKINIPFLGSKNNKSKWNFDAFIVPQRQEIMEDEIVVGISSNMLTTTVFALDKGAKSGINAWYIFYSVDSKGTGKVSVWSKSSAWGEIVARRSAYKVCTEN